MNISMLKGKIHRATVKQAELDYVGSITVDPVLLEAAGILEYEHVHIVDVNNGSRFETYTIPGEPGSGMICLNGPAARCVATGDKIIIIAYADMTPEEAKTFEPKVAPQVIQALFNVPWFGPPVSFTSPSTCSWVGHMVSGLRHDTNAPY